MPETQHPTHSTTLALPESVAAYFDVLNTFATKATYTAGHTFAEIILTATDLYDLATQVRSLEAELARATSTPASIARPTVNADGTHTALVHVTDDVRSLFDILTGVAEVRFNPIEDRATVIFFEDDEYDLSVTVTSLNEELAATFGYDTAQVQRPERLAVGEQNMNGNPA